MGDKTIVNGGASVTEFDAENLQTDREKKRDGISVDVRTDRGTKTDPGTSSAPRKKRG
jgi:hypothetical protein